MKKLFTILLVLLFSSTVIAQRQTESLDRGLVAIKTSNKVYLSWRVSGKEWFDVSYNIYKNGTKINNSPISTSSNYNDDNGTLTDEYAVSSIVNGVEQTPSKVVKPLENNYFDIPIDRPDGGNVNGSSYTYSANDASTADLDGDGELDIILKWDPSNSKDNSQNGYTGDVIIDAYKQDGTHLWRVNLGKNIRAGAHYTQFLVFDFDNDGKAEMICRTADGTNDGKGTIIGDANADYRNSSGRILSGPEFLTVFDGMTGEALKTIDYEPARGAVSNWGDSYGNRVDRFGAVVAYLDGEHPSAVMARGYYERTMLAAYDWDGTTLNQRWLFNSESGGLLAYSGQGNHSISVADVDNDGKDEIIYGQMTMDDDGHGLYSTGLGHADALHVTDHDPDRPGLEVFTPHEDGGNGVSFRSAETGEIYWQYKKAGEDIGRGLSANILSNYRGSESWASSGLGMYDVNGNHISSIPSSINFAIYWDADVQRELLNGIFIQKIDNTILTATGMHSCNGTKSTPTLQADLFGDWREEVIWASENDTYLRVFTSTAYTSKRVYSLMHDSQYRTAIAWQNVGYNQPPHPSFLLENDLALPMPDVFSGLKWQGKSGAMQWLAADNFVTENGSSTSFQNGDTAIFSFGGNHSEAIELTQSLSPGLVVVSSPDDYTFSGIGTLEGSMSLYKHQKGSLTLNGNYNYTGATVVTDGALILNGTLENSNVTIIGGIWGGTNSTVNKGGRLSGNGHIKESLNLRNRAALIVNETLTVGKDLSIENYAVAYFDMAANAENTINLVTVTNNLSIDNNVDLKINLTEGKLNPGDHVLFTYGGSFTGNTEQINIIGLDGIFHRVVAENGKLMIRIDEPRAAIDLLWNGDESNIWGLNGDYNWTNNGTKDYYLPNDNITFPSMNEAKEIIIEGNCAISSLTFDANSFYKLSGEGEISGTGHLVKMNTGRLNISTINSYEGKTSILYGTLAIPNIANGHEKSAIGKSGISPEKLEINGGILEITSSGSSDKGITLGSNDGSIFMPNENTTQQLSAAIVGAGSLYKKGPGTLALSGESSYSGNTIIESGSIQLMSDKANQNGFGEGHLIIKNGSLIQYDNQNTSNISNLIIEVPSNSEANYVMDSRCYNRDSLFGAGILNIKLSYTRTNLEGNWSNFEGRINVSADGDGADFRVNNVYGYTNAKLHLGDKVKAYRLGNDTVRIGALSGSSSASLTNSVWIVGNKNIESEFQGSIIAGELIKEGTSPFILSNGGNSYTGGTTVKTGNLRISNTSGNATGTGPIVVKSGAVLSGNGISKSHISLETGAYISPGNGIGTFITSDSIVCSKNSIINIELNPENGTCDKLQSAYMQINQAVLFLLNASSQGFAIGEEFKILASSKIEGQFSSIYPKQPSDGLYWDTSKLYTDGIISTTDTEPTGISETLHQDFKIYPNPAINTINIDFLKTDKFNKSISIFNLNGALIKKLSSQHVKSTIDISDIESGIYILNIKYKNINVSQKINIK